VGGAARGGRIMGVGARLCGGGGWWGGPRGGGGGASRSLRRGDHSSREVLSTDVSLRVILRPQE